MALESANTVLTVDDNDVLRYSLVRMLLDAGYKVIEARTGHEALKLASSLPDLITLDVNLPDMNGFQVCRKLKSDPLTSHIPILHVSGTFVDPEFRVMGLKGGADAYLAEPINRAELIATVEALLRIKSSEKHALQRAEAANTERAEVQQQNVELEERVRQRTAEVELKSVEIRRLNMDLMKLQDEERRRIARELHDSTGQLLASLNLNFSKLSAASDLLSEDTKKVIAESAEITSELTSHLRTVSYLLHPPLLDEVGLASALEWYVKGYTERSHVAVDLEISSGFGRLRPDMEIAIFRIIQECLTNVHKHSGSQWASVRLNRDRERITIEVKDSGTKFAGDTFTATPGTGILGMRERVNQLGGEFKPHFGASGVLIDVTIPFSG
jgi:signal transduction histidine kinase